jgi:hypothetical protein
VLVLLVVCDLFCLLRYFLRTATVIGREKITGDVLNARAKANGYKKGQHREDSRRDCNKHKDDTKKDQDNVTEFAVPPLLYIRHTPPRPCPPC